MRLQDYERNGINRVISKKNNSMLKISQKSIRNNLSEISRDRDNFTNRVLKHNLAKPDGLSEEFGK